MKHLLITLLLVYLLCVLVLYLAQRKLMYFPTVAPQKSNHASFNLVSGDLDLKVVVSYPDNQTASDNAILYFAGNAENVWWTPQLMQQAFAGYTVYFLNYPGYGGSSGSPSEQSILQAASDLYEHVSQRHSAIAVVGRSLGTGVAVDVASKHAISAMVLISPYDSIANVAAGHYPIFPVKWLVKDKFDSLSKVQSLREQNGKAQVLLFSAGADEVVPPGHSTSLARAMQSAGVSVKTIEFPGYQHNTISEHPEFQSLVQKFLTENL